MSVVSERVGGRRGKELVSPIVMEGGYAAIRRVEEARKKEVLQVRLILCLLERWAGSFSLWFWVERRHVLFSVLEFSLIFPCPIAIAPPRTLVVQEAYGIP